MNFASPYIEFPKKLTVRQNLEVYARLYGVKNKKNFYSLSKNSNLDKAASNLYKVFRIIKKNGYKRIQISKIPNIGSGVAINDRIRRASKF